MPSLADHQSNDFTKVLAIGHSKSGKTGSLVSLVKAGYKLRILDFDNLLDVLKAYVRKECPERLGDVEFRSLRDKYKSSPKGPILDGRATAFVRGLEMIDQWKYDDTDLGRPDDWGPDCILVIDSLSRLCDAALDFHRELGGPKADGRMIYFHAQEAVESMLAHITSENFRTNLIVIAHVQFIEQPDGTTKGFPQGVGSALSPRIPTYFPTVVLYTNKGGKRTIQTNSTPLIDLGNPAPFEMAKEFPIEDGLATIFATLRSKPPTEAKPPKPTAVTLRRA